MPKFSLVPEPKRESGQRGEDVRIACLERAITMCLDLEEALSDGNDSLMIWLDRLEEADQQPTIPELREVVTKIYGQITKIHVAISSARKPPRA